MSDAPRLRVMTYNVRAFRDDWRAAARVVAKVQPDVLALQEVSRRLFPSRRVRAFAALAGMSWPFLRVRAGGTTILTAPHVRVRSASHHRLRVPFWQAVKEGARGYAVATLATPAADPVTVVSVHLSLRPEERVRHTRALRPGIPGSGSLVIAGDINEDEAGLAWQLLASGGRTRLVSERVPTFPADHPAVCLDAVFASAELARADGPPVEVDQALLRGGSDHRPVWVDLRLR